MFRILPLLLILLSSPALAAGWPGGKRTLSTSVVEQFFALSHSLLGDAFGRLRVSEPVIELDAKFTADLLPLRFGTEVSGGGAVAHASPLPQARLRVSGASQVAAIQSYEHARYRAAQGQLIRMTGVMGAPTAAYEARMGYFSATDGLYLAQTPTGPVFVIRSSTSGVVVEQRYPQSAWNIDRLNGLDSLETLDLTKGVVFVIDLQYLGHGTVRFGFDLDGGTHWAHRVQHSNVTDVPYMTSGSQPLRWEAVTTALYAGGNRDLMATCGSVVREGGTEEPGASGEADTGLTPVTVTAADAAGEVHLLLRRRAGYRHAALRPLEVDCLNTGGNPLRWRLLLKPTLAGAAPVWTSVAGGAAIGEVSTTAGISSTGGIPLAGGYVPASALGGRGTVVSVDLARSLAVVGDLAGTSDILALELNQAGGATTALCSLKWEALQ